MQQQYTSERSRSEAPGVAGPVGGASPIASRVDASNDHGLDWPLHHRFGRSDGRDDPLGSVGRPSWRGRVHLLALLTAIPAMTLLFIAADGARAKVGVSLYGVSICAMFAASTTYHRWVHDLRARASWRRADHASIFGAIAGSSTPIILMVVPGGWRVALLVAVWGTAAVGAVIKLGRWHRSDAVGTRLYAVVSALAGLALPWLWIHGGVAAAACYVASGFLYIFGARWFARTWPRLTPSVFSYHEVWHVFTVGAAAAHFVAVCWIAA